MKTRVYTIDDHPLIRRGISELIGSEHDMEMCGQAEDASTGLEGIIKVQPDLVIVDITLEGSSGLKLIKSIRAYQPKIHIVVLSMHHESVYALRVLKAGARAYIMKQDTVTHLVAAIRRVRNGELSVSTRVAGEMLNEFVRGRKSEDGALSGSTLSDRELDVVRLIGAGTITRDIAHRLKLSVKTIETHRAHIKTKVRVQTAPQLVQFCVRWVHENNKRRNSNDA